MKDLHRIVAAVLFGILAVSLISLTQAPPRELGVIRAVLADMQSEVGGRDPLASMLLISNPSTCYDDGQSNPVEAEVRESFLRSNRDGAPPIRLSHLTDLVAVVDFQEARLWRGRVFGINAGEYSLVVVSRVGFWDGKALLCVESRNLGQLFLLESGASGWSVVGRYPAWTIVVPPKAVAADRDTESLARRERVASLCARGALDPWSRGR